MLTVVCWLWGKGYTGGGWRAVYSAEHVNTFARMFRANCTLPHRVVCITDMPKGITDCETYPLWNEWEALGKNGTPNCFRRLRLFDPAFTRGELKAEGRVLHIDLDCTILGNIDALLEPVAPFRIVKGLHNTQYNGSMYLLEPGAHEHLWHTFHPQDSPLKLREWRSPEGKKLIGSDQAWISYNLREQAIFSKADGVWQLQQFCSASPFERERARIVFFAGGVKPWNKILIARYKKAGRQLYFAYKQHVQKAAA